LSPHFCEYSKSDPLHDEIDQSFQLFDKNEIQLLYKYCEKQYGNESLIYEDINKSTAKVYEHESEDYLVAWHPNKPICASAVKKKGKLYHLYNEPLEIKFIGNLIHSVNGFQDDLDITCLSWDQKSQKLASATTKGEIKIWDENGMMSL